MLANVLLDPLFQGAVLALLVFWAVGAYNRLVRLRSKVQRIFATLAQQFDRYGEWMQAHAPERLEPAIGATAVEPLNPLHTLHALAADRWAGLSGAVTQFGASLSAARAQPMDGAAMAALMAARQVLDMAWQRLDDGALALARAGEAGSASAEGNGPEALKAQWEQITTQTRATDKAFALAVNAYNQAVRQFPAVVLAWAFGFRPAQTL